MIEQCSELSDDLAIVRRRMRHLVRFNIEPKPLLHHVERGVRSALAGGGTNGSTEQLAWQVLAVQMGHTALASALD
jgi:hypothetical protein